jgi:microcystin-dependent protein
MKSLLSQGTITTAAFCHLFMSDDTIGVTSNPTLFAELVNSGYLPFFFVTTQVPANPPNPGYYTPDPMVWALNTPGLGHDTIFGWYITVNVESQPFPVFAGRFDPPVVIPAIGMTFEINEIQMELVDSGDSTLSNIPGAIAWFATNTLPPNYIPCDGSAVSRTTFGRLFLAIGTTYGNGDGVNTFNIPDLRDRSPIGISPGSLGSDRPTVRLMGDSGGEESHILVSAETPSATSTLNDPGHSHTLNDPGHEHTPNSGGNFFTSGNDGLDNLSHTPDINAFQDGATSSNTTGITLDAAPTGVNLSAVGGDGPHNTMHPFLTLLAGIAF